ncbi:MAG: hypothetical protein ABIS18_02355, partial [Actinomycetota bacterium]
LSEGMAVLNHALSASDRIDDYLQAQGRAAMGYLAIFSGDHPRAEMEANAALEIFEKSGKEDGIDNCYRILGIAAFGRRDFEAAVKFHDKSIELSRRRGDEWGLAFSLTNRGNVEMSFPEAERLYEESRKIRLGRSDHWGLVWSDFRLGILRVWQARLDDAVELFRGAKAEAEVIGYGQGRVLATLGLAEAACLAADYATGRSCFEDSLEMAGELNDGRVVQFSKMGLAQIALDEGDVAECRALIPEIRFGIGDVDPFLWTLIG